MKRTRIVFTVLSSILLACWIGLFIAFIFMFGSYTDPVSNFATFFTSQIWEQIVQAFKFNFNQDNAYFNGYIDVIGTYSVAGIYGIFAILAIIMAIAKKRPALIVYFFLAILFAVPGIQTMSYFSQFIGGWCKNTTLPLFEKIILYGLMGFAGLEIIFSLILVILAPFSFLSSKAKAAQKQAKADKKARIVAAANPEVPAISHVPEPEPREPQLSRYELANLIREIVRDEVSRAEAVRAAAAPAQPIVITPPAAPEKAPEEPQTPGSSVQTVTGATFGGPLVVQYFYGIGPAQAQAQPVVQAAPAQEPAPVKEEPAPVEEPVEEVVEETVVEEVAPAVVEETVVVEEPTPVEEPVVEEPAPVVEEVVPELPTEAKAPIIRISFEERIISADKETRENYNELKNELLSWGVKSRISNSGDTFRLHRKTYCKITVAGKSLKLYLALDPKDYEGSTIPHTDAGEKNAYSEIPFVFKVKSALSMKRAKQLIQDAMEKDGLEQGPVESVNWVKEIKASLKAAK